MRAVTESFICSKYPDRGRCEDGLYIGKNFIAVIDGVTSKGELDWSGRGYGGSGPVTGGRYAKEVLLSAMERLPGDTDPESAVLQLNGALSEAGADRREILEVKKEERLQAVVIIFSRSRREVWSFGDCQCMIGQRRYDHGKQIDGYLAQMRSVVDHMELLKGKTAADLMRRDTGREYILPVLKAQAVFANTLGEYCYDVLDGFSIHPEHVSVHQVGKGEEVVLASDGYPVLKQTLAESERELEVLLKSDPLCIKTFKCTKGVLPGNVSFDDRTYVRFTAE